MSISPPPPSQVPARLHQILLVLVIASGALLRLDRLLSTPEFVSPDALKHFMAAEELHVDDPTAWFSVYRGYAPFAWVLRLFFGLSSHQPVIQRLATVLISVLLIYLVARIVQARLEPWMGVFAAYLTAINPALIESSDSGIREDPYAVLWLTLFFLVFVWRPAATDQVSCFASLHRISGCSQSSLRRAAIGLVACLTFLIRVDSLPPLIGFITVVLLSHGFWKRFREWFEALAPPAILLGLVLFANWTHHDDPLYFVDREKSVFRYWANVEFKGQPGFPSVEEVRANSRAGEPLSATQYFGGVLGWKETASRFLKGYAELLGKHVLTGIYRFDAFPNQISFVGILTLLGITAELWHRRWVIPLLIPLLFTGTAWTYDIVGGHDFRLFLIAVPFAIIAASEGAGLVWSLVCRIGRKWVRRGAGCLALGMVLLNPWNHDLKTSFPWRVGPTGSVPAGCAFDSGLPDRVPTLVGLECREIGPLGLSSPPLTRLEPRRRFLTRTWWRVSRSVPASASYRVTTFQEGKGQLGATRYKPLTRKYPLRFWQPGQIVLDELECWVYSKPVPGQVQVRVEVSDDGVVEDATYSTVFTLE